MGRWLGGWLRATFDYNPTFPLSALGLLVGLRLLMQDGTISPAPAGAAGGVGVLEAYEVALLATALLVLWPRRIAYETTSILIIGAVVRFAAPFLVIGLAADGHPGSALALGAAVWLLMLGKALAVQRRVGLAFTAGERAYDAVLYALPCLAFPLFAYWLAAVTGDGLSHAGSRVARLVAWWSLAALLAPLALSALGRGARGETGPLRSRTPAQVWRCLTAAGCALLLFSASWLAGEAATAFELLPLALVGLAIGASLWRAAGRRTPTWIALAPAGALALVALFRAETLQGRLLTLSHPASLAATLAVSALAVPLLAPDRRGRALRALGLVAALLPLKLSETGREAELYALAVACTVTALGLARRRDGAVAAAATALLLALHLTWTDLEGALRLVTGVGVLLAVLVSWRVPRGAGEPLPRAATLGFALLLGAPLARAALGIPGAIDLVLAVTASGGLLLLGRRYGEVALSRSAIAVAVAGPSRAAAGVLSPGAALVVLAFAALPAGAALALRRERRRAAEEADLAERAAVLAGGRRVRA